ncbi:MAG: hypothetical protein EOS58_17050 [Mesorhizobium sp.]|nr:MAG: hypothetical protein EOS58_17050 [Mesorhizobium sp.]
MLMLNRFTGFGVRRASGGGGGTDPHFANVVLLLGFEGSDGSTTLTDESTATNKGSGTANGNAQIDTAQAKFGSASGLFDGSGDYWTFADHADWNLSGEFTIELFVRRAATGSNTYILGQGDGSGSMAWYLNSTWSAGDNGSLVFAYSINGGLGGNLMVTAGTIPAGTATLNAWHYIAVTRNASGKVRIWFDGTLLVGNTPANLTTFNSSDTLGIGRAISTAIWNGWMDEIRITKGVCRYDTDSSIAVPTAAFPRS